MLEHIKSLIVLLLAVSAKCENCVTNDFRGNFYKTFNNGNPICNGMAQWVLGNYSSLDIQRPHTDSVNFISPSEVLSCVSSYEFEMKSTGILEAFVYMESTSQRDQIVVLANEVSETGNTVVAGMVMLTPLSTNYTNGWHVLKINLVSASTFNGYVSFLGVTSPGSTVIIDSFRYIPPKYDADCYVYDGDFVTSNPLETPEPSESGECITYDFETGFDEKFNSERGLCTGFTQWNLLNYTSSTVTQPSSESQKFISPQSAISCISSFTFDAEDGGVVEVNVFMESGANSDQIAVLVNQILDDSNDVVTGSGLVTPLFDNYVDGWQVLRIVLSGEKSFLAYISFLGLASEESIVLIDSFKYIPPTMTSEECHIYKDEVSETTVAPDTTIPVDSGENCVTYNFEADFEESFDNDNVLCNGFSTWHLGDYKSLAIESIDPQSSTFISPNETSSCISSFIFRMMPGGVVEVNVYMDSMSDLDYIVVLAKKVNPGRIDTVAGFQLYYASNTNFIKGWNVLKVTVDDFSTFDGYISFLGLASEESIVLIDSFKYIPPTMTSEECHIYKDEVSETTVAPDTTIPVDNGENCVTYNFETDFEESFDNDNVLCNGFSTWHLGDYKSLAIESIDPQSSTFISPNETSSCISSFIFRMMPGGVVEVNVYMDSMSDLDYIVVLAKKVDPGRIDTVAGFQLYYASNTNFIKGWNVLKVTVDDFSTFDGYITLLGSAAEDSVVLIDSFKYIPPNTTETCEIY